MTRKITFILFALVFASSSMFAQGVADENTYDAEQNASWRMGKANYSAKPKNAWELGIHAGHYIIDGDVDRELPAGFGVGLHLRKAIHYAFSIRADLFYGQAKGLETQAWKHSTVGAYTGPDGSSIGGGLVEQEYNPYSLDNGHPDGGWFPAHKTRQVYGAFQGIINIGNLLFHKPNNKWNWYVGLGVGLNSYQTKLDLLDANGNAYTDLLNKVGWTSEKFDTKSGRDDIKSALKDIYDGDYETEGPRKAGIFRLGDETNIHFMFTGSAGVSRKINKRINIGFEHQIMAADNDYLDGIRFRTADDLTADVDLEHYTNIRLAINLGNMDEVAEPLYWLNPLDNTMNDIASLKQRPILDLTDSDSDGVIDMMDQEIDSPAGAIVDTRGVTLDSDGDGVPDYKDKEPFSPIGYEIGEDGIAVVEKCLTESEVNSLIDNKSTSMMSEMKTLMASDCGKWFLPMIHFDNDKYKIKPEFYGQLHHVANVMKLCPSACVTVAGYTDARSSDEYNNVLSYNRADAAVNYLTTTYGIDRSRFVLTYGGESNPLVGSAKTSAEKYMNRRVEFRLCAGESDMERPEGPNAGQGGVKSSGSTFSGNKNSGY
jgi:hypothetical protein